MNIKSLLTEGIDPRLLIVLSVSTDGRPSTPHPLLLRTTLLTSSSTIRLLQSLAKRISGHLHFHFRHRKVAGREHKSQQRGQLVLSFIRGVAATPNRRSAEDVGGAFIIVCLALVRCCGRPALLRLPPPLSLKAAGKAGGRSRAPRQKGGLYPHNPLPFPPPTPSPAAIRFHRHRFLPPTSAPNCLPLPRVSLPRKCRCGRLGGHRLQQQNFADESEPQTRRRHRHWGWGSDSSTIVALRLRAQNGRPPHPHGHRTTCRSIRRATRRSCLPATELRQLLSLRLLRPSPAWSHTVLEVTVFRVLPAGPTVVESRGDGSPRFGGPALADLHEYLVPFATPPSVPREISVEFLTGDTRREVVAATPNRRSVRRGLVHHRVSGSPSPLRTTGPPPPRPPASLPRSSLQILSAWEIFRVLSK